MTPITDWDLALIFMRINPVATEYTSSRAVWLQVWGQFEHAGSAKSASLRASARGVPAAWRPAYLKLAPSPQNRCSRWVLKLPRHNWLCWLIWVFDLGLDFDVEAAFSSAEEAMWTRTNRQDGGERESRHRDVPSRPVRRWTELTMAPAESGRCACRKPGFQRAGRLPPFGRFARTAGKRNALDVDLNVDLNVDHFHFGLACFTSDMPQ